MDPPHISRTRAHNIVIQVPCVIGNAHGKQTKSPLDPWRLLIDDNVLDDLVEHTNEK